MRRSHLASVDGRAGFHGCARGLVGEAVRTQEVLIGLGFRRLEVHCLVVLCWLSLAMQDLANFLLQNESVQIGSFDRKKYLVDH